MGHINTGPGEHDLTASAFIVQTNGEKPRLLLHRHKKLHAWLQFGGHVERHENPWQAVAHEIQEESGFDLSQLKVLQPINALGKLASDKADLHPAPLAVNTHDFDGRENHYHIDMSWAFVTDQDPLHALADGESEEIQSFSLSELEALHPPEIFPNVKHIAQFVLTTCLHEWEKIPADEFRL